MAGLDAACVSARNADAILLANWEVVKGWSEEKRYHLIDEVEARELFNAVADVTHGVLSWVQMHW